MAVIFSAGCILLPVLLNIIVKALKNKIDEQDRTMDRLQQYIVHNELNSLARSDEQRRRMSNLEAYNQNEGMETETESLLNRLAKLDEQLKRANDAWAGNNHVKSQKPFGVYKKKQGPKPYMCNLCKAVFLAEEIPTECPACKQFFYADARIPISKFKYKWLRYWRSRQ